MSAERYHAVFVASYLYWCEEGEEPYCPRPAEREMDLFRVPEGVTDPRVIGSSDVQKALAYGLSFEPKILSLRVDGGSGLMPGNALRCLVGSDFRSHLSLTLFQGSRVIAQTGRYTLIASRGDQVLWTREESCEQERIPEGVRLDCDEPVRLVLSLNESAYRELKIIEESESFGAVMIVGVLDALSDAHPEKFRRGGNGGS
jgi:hypothetical protein